MKNTILFAIILCSAGPLAAMGKTSVEVQVGVGGKYGWRGPGWYYGHYFMYESDYIAWMEGSAPYSANYQTTIWIGPGWYGGYWYHNRRDWDNHHHYHSYDRHYDRQRDRNWKNNRPDRGGNRQDRDGNRPNRGGGRN